MVEVLGSIPHKIRTKKNSIFLRVFFGTFKSDSMKLTNTLRLVSPEKRYHLGFRLTTAFSLLLVINFTVFIC